HRRGGPLPGRRGRARFAARRRGGDRLGHRAVRPAAPAQGLRVRLRGQPALRAHADSLHDRRGAPRVLPAGHWPAGRWPARSGFDLPPHARRLPQRSAARGTGVTADGGFLSLLRRYFAPPRATAAILLLVTLTACTDLAAPWLVMLALDLLI